MMRSKVTAKIVAMTALLMLCGCGILLAKLRPSFDQKILSVGTPQAVVEKEFGKPTSQSSSEAGMQATYRTSLVDDLAKAYLVDDRALGDILTLGAAELIDPINLRVRESKDINIQYDQDDHVANVTVVCQAGHWTGVERKYFVGFSCTSSGPADF